MANTRVSTTIPKDEIINANPTKEFFISMLTRDIDIKAAILELIDNSIDGAKNISDRRNLKDLYIKINYDATYFEIEDNCGGISINIAKDRAFRFGRPEKSEHLEGLYTGVFGIGMKRALFRLGKVFTVNSVCENESFNLKVDVNEWVKDQGPDWSFRFQETKRGERNPLTKCGTKIRVENLNEVISQSFNDSFFNSTLITHIEKYRTTAVEDGLKITVNRKQINFMKEILIVSSDIQPFSSTINVGDVKISIIAGLAPKGHPENAGWYIYCNGRLIVYADRTELTGWGKDGVRTFHNSLAGFRGFVFFESENAEELPWNTSKTGVDISSPYYISALNKMKTATKQVSSFTNKIDKRDEIFREDREELEKEIYNESRVVKLTREKIEELIGLESTFNVQISFPEAMEKVSTISFQKPRNQVEALKKQVKAKSNKDLGEKIYDYYILREGEDLL